MCLSPSVLPCCRHWATSGGSLGLTTGAAPSQGRARGPQQPEGPRLPCPGLRAALPGPRLPRQTGPLTPASFRKNGAEVCGGGAGGGGGVSGKVPGAWCGRWRPGCGPGSRLPSPHELSTFSRAGSLWGRALPASSGPLPPSRPVPAITRMVVQQTARVSAGPHPGVRGLRQNAGARGARVGTVQGRMTFPGQARKGDGGGSLECVFIRAAPEMWLPKGSRKTRSLSSESPASGMEPASSDSTPPGPSSTASLVFLFLNQTIW